MATLPPHPLVAILLFGWLTNQMAAAVFSHTRHQALPPFAVSRLCGITNLRIHERTASRMRCTRSKNCAPSLKVSAVSFAILESSAGSPLAL